MKIADNKAAIIRELENCIEYFSNMDYRRRMLRQAIQIIKEVEDSNVRSSNSR